MEQKGARGRPPAPKQNVPGYAVGQRRSRYEEEGRDFQCQMCEKNYLSKPALYLHVKQKHGMAYAAQIGSTPNVGGPVNYDEPRKRGRPRLIDQRSHGMMQITDKNNPCGDGYFTHEERAGGPTDVLHGFQEIFEQRFQKEYE